MENQKNKNKNWVETMDELWGTYNTNDQIKLKTSMLKSSLCDYSDAYIFVRRAITIPNTGAVAALSNRKKI